jgi:hypothetical protein
VTQRRRAHLFLLISLALLLPLLMMLRCFRGAGEVPHTGIVASVTQLTSIFPLISVLAAAVTLRMCLQVGR